ncbi:MBL fold metallo-hydrolase [Clostridium colicanis]|uniref:Metallo-beta-lactamase superfamily protein n=1 Tax=Clostridium colicanis DSM 13634 TaxID=1121305 RepID=A0A151AN20_9CLOT|nr:MBL fold metallo-hydrolase [Clostridium colicanis]KYH29021.1 metallo-beta-lactamase superfamily protein [Clostridium colicanis DSM 13634]
MKIVTLIENTLEDNSTLIKEHGLSIFIETEEGNILFDTGQSGNFILNAEKLNINLNKVDFIVLSHGHYDHAGGMKPLLDYIQTKPKLYVSQYFFSHSQKYYLTDANKSNLKYIGIDFNEDFTLDKNIPINYINSNSYALTSKISIVSNFERSCDFEPLNESMKIKINDKLYTDSFDDEIALTIDTPKGLLVIVGCSHLGIVNIVNSIIKRTNKKIYGIIGGTHLIEADTYRINKTIQCFKDMNIQLLGVSHCTGKSAIETLKKETDKLFINCTGKVIYI